MKKILITSLSFLLLGCVSNKNETQQVQIYETEFQKSHQYNPGDVVYLKPDSTEAVITDIMENWYHVDYRDKDGQIQTYNIYDSEIYNKK